MSLKTRLIGLSALWILFMLLFFNVFIYNYMLKKTTDAENRMLWNKAQIILRNPDIHVSTQWKNKDLLNEFSAKDTLIRIILPNGNIAIENSSNEELSSYLPVYRTDYHSAMDNFNGFRRLFIQVPIIANGVQIGLLELGKALNVVSDMMELIATSLTVTSVSVLLFSMITGTFFTRLIFKPLRQLVETMKTIQNKGDFILLSPEITSKKDEVGQLGQTFNKMMYQLRENDRKQKQFVADASHELKTPLTVIESYASLLKRWGNSDPSIREEAVEAILSESIRLKGLIHSLLKMAAVEREQTMDLHPTAIVPLIRSAVKQMSHAFKRHITFYPEAEDIQIFADQEQMKQLQFILLDNAIKYSRKRIHVECKEEEEEVILRISDEGLGIGKKDLPYLFERFYRVDQARERKTGGTGLGLAIAKQIVDLHYGNIQIDSDEGKGTSVTVRFPKEDMRGVS